MTTAHPRPDLAAYNDAARMTQSQLVTALRDLLGAKLVAYLETRGATGIYDERSGRYTLYTGTQGAMSVRDRIAAILNISKETLRLVTQDVGGGFGQKISVSVEQPLLLLAARKFGRPVKWMAERMEASLADAHGRDSRMKGELAFDSEARILALRDNLAGVIAKAISLQAARYRGKTDRTQQHGNARADDEFNQ